MKLEEIQQICEYQQLNWNYADGNIVQWDIPHKKLVLDHEQSGEMIFSLSPTAENQLIERLGLVGTFSDWLNENKPAWTKNHDFWSLAVAKRIEQLRYSKRTKPTRVIFDTKTKDAKAVKTERFTMLDNVKVLNATLKVADQQYFAPEYSFINDDNLALTFNVMKRTSASKVNEPIGLGVRTTHSITGLSQRFGLSGTLNMTTSVILLRCLNGAVSRQKYAMTSVSHIYEDMIPRFDTGVKVLLADETIPRLVERAFNRPAFIEDLSDDRLAVTKISRQHFDGIREAYELEPLGKTAEGVNVWGLMNAITRYATHIYPKKPNYDYYEQQMLMSAGFNLLYL